MSDKLSQHDPFYTGPLWGQNGTYVKPDEKYWLGGTSTAPALSSLLTVDLTPIEDSISDLEASMIALAQTLSANDIVKEDLEIFTFEHPISGLPFTFDTTYAKSILVENKDDTFHIMLDGIGVKPEYQAEIDADFDYLIDKTYTINAVSPTIVGSDFSYDGATILPANELSASSACIRITSLANNITL